MFKKLLFATTASPVCDNAAKVAFDLELDQNGRAYVLSGDGCNQKRIIHLTYNYFPLERICALFYLA